MIQRLSKRITQKDRQGGLHPIELLVVIIIIGILLAIAIPSYLSFRSRAEVSAAKANVRAAIPGVEAFLTRPQHVRRPAPHEAAALVRRGDQEHLRRPRNRSLVLRPEHRRPGHLQEGRPVGRHRGQRLLAVPEDGARVGSRPSSTWAGDSPIRGLL